MHERSLPSHTLSHSFAVKGHVLPSDHKPLVKMGSDTHIREDGSTRIASDVEIHPRINVADDAENVTGSAGPPGPQGPIGPQGDTGAQGAIGPQGEQG